MRLLLLAAAFPFLQTAAAVTAQSYWKVPDGNQSDFTSTYTEGDSLPITWDGWNAGWTDGYLNGTTVADLWVTSYNFLQYQYSQFLIDNVNVSEAGFCNWTINVNTTSLGHTAEYVLRFIAPGETYSSSVNQLSSPGFIVLQRQTPTKTTTTPTPTSTQAPPTSTTSAVTVTPTTAPKSAVAAASSSGLSAGAKAGIGVGVAIGVIGLASLAFMWRRRGQFASVFSSSQHSEAGPAELDAMPQEPGKKPYSVVPVYELSGYSQPAVELDAGRPV